MKYTTLIILLLFPLATLFAQVNEPDYATPDSLEVELDDQEIQDLNSGKAVVDESTVMEMLDLVSNITYFRSSPTASTPSVSRPWRRRPPSR